MATTGIVNRSPDGLACTECNESSDCTAVVAVRGQARGPSFLVLRKLRSRDRAVGRSAHQRHVETKQRHRGSPSPARRVRTPVRRRLGFSSAARSLSLRCSGAIGISVCNGGIDRLASLHQLSPS